MILEWIATGMAIVGAILNASKSIKGFYIWIITNSIFMYISILNKLYDMAFLFLTYLLISIGGIIKWKK